MTKSSALEAAPHCIRINAVCPGLENIPMIATLDAKQRKARSAANPLGRIAQASEITYAVVWLCSDKSSFVTAHRAAGRRRL
jgi:NAD(P)-dependent dehydrogenase (short-subunit alcohol dehydrogenase family)